MSKSISFTVEVPSTLDIVAEVPIVVNETAQVKTAEALTATLVRDLAFEVR